MSRFDETREWCNKMVHEELDPANCEDLVMHIVERIARRAYYRGHWDGVVESTEVNATNG